MFLFWEESLPLSPLLLLFLFLISPVCAAVAGGQSLEHKQTRYMLYH